MAKDVADVIGNAIGRAAREAAKNIQSNAGKSNSLPERVTGAVSDKMKDISGSKGLAAGVGLATLAPLAAKGAGKLVKGIGGSSNGGPAKKAGDALKKGAKSAAKKGGSQGEPGVGKGRRMPIQQDIDIGMPIAQVYKQWTEFEEWPTFMHRLENVSQDDDKHVSFKTKIWGISKEFRAEIVEQEENARIKWQVTDGVTHTGVVTFHELGPRLTRMELNLDVQPGSMIEKAARGMRHVKRAVRADMARFKAHVLMQEEESPRSQSSSSSSSGRSRSSSSSSKRRSSSSSSKRGSSSSSKRRSPSSTKSRSSSSSTKSRSSSSKRRSPSARKSSSSSASSNGRSSSSSRTRASSSSNGRSRSSSSNGRSRSGSGRKRATTRS